MGRCSQIADQQGQSSRDLSELTLSALLLGSDLLRNVDAESYKTMLVGGGKEVKEALRRLC